MNPYLKKYGPGGETNNPYDPTTSYIRPKKVIVDGKEMSTYSNEYRDLYNTGNLMSVDYEGLPNMYAPEVEVTAEAPEWLKEKRRIEAQGRVAEAVRKGTGSFARPILDTGLELSGVPGAVRFAQDPIKNLQGTANVLSYTNVPGLIGHGIDYARGNPFFNVTEEDLQGLGNTLDVVGLATLGAGTAFKMAPKAISSIPRMLGRIPDVNPNMGLRFADEAIEANKALSTRQRQVVPQTTQSISKEYTPWTMQEMPGYHLQSTMSNNPKGLHTYVAKDGTIDTKSALDHLKRIEGEERYNVVLSGLQNRYGINLENIPKRIDYNILRKNIQDDLWDIGTGKGQQVGQYAGMDMKSYGIYKNSQPFLFGPNFESRVPPSLGYEEGEVLLDGYSFANKNKFIGGSTAHDMPKETLGHSRSFTNPNEPGIYYSAERQSNWAQEANSNIVDPLTGMKTKRKDIYDRLLRNEKSLTEGIKEQDALIAQGKEWAVSQKERFEEQLKAVKNIIKDHENYTNASLQEKLVMKNINERMLQEDVAYAASKGNTKYRMPSEETMAKIQGWSREKVFSQEAIEQRSKIMQKQDEIMDELDILYNIPKDKRSTKDIEIIDFLENKYKDLNKEIREINNSQPYGDYNSAQKTILKHTSQSLKDAEKLFGVKLKSFTDAKGNTWYEFDIPDAYKKGKAEIKAFSMPGIIGAGAAGVGINEMMQQPKEKFRTGGIVNPYLSYNNGGKVIIDGKEVNIDSSEYRKLYESGNLMNVDKDGIPVRWSNEEAVVTAKLTDEEKKNIEKKRREQEAMYNTLQAGLNAGLQDGFDNQGNPIFVPDKNGGIDAAMRSMLYEGIPELTGIPSLVRVLKDPMGHLNSALRTMDEVSTLGTMPYGSYNTPEDVSKTLDVVGAAGTVMPLAKGLNATKGLNIADKAISSMPKMLGKIPVLSYADDIVKTSKMQGKISLPKYTDIYRWQPDEIPEFLKKSGENLTPEQKALTGSWYNIEPQMGFYMRTRPGSGTLLHSKLPEYKIKELQKTMPAEAKGMSGKAINVAKSDDYHPNELIVPKELRQKGSNPIRFEINPQEYIKNTDEYNELKEKILKIHGSTLEESVQLYPFFENIYKDEATNMFLKKLIQDKIKKKRFFNTIPSEYVPFKTGGKVNTYNPDNPTLPSAPINFFSNYDMRYNNPFVDDIHSAMNGMIKARMAIDSTLGKNPAAIRMTSVSPKEYTFTGDEMFYDEKQNIPAGATGTHYTTGEGNVMFPIIQEGQDGNLFFNRYASPTDREAMRFETPEEASYFGENYKSIAPMMYNERPTQEDRKKLYQDINNVMSGKKENTGVTMTKLNPYEEYTYQQWVKSLTPNLRGSAEDKNYDMRGAWKSGEQPELFYNNEQGNFQTAHPIDVKQQGSIYEPHLFSRDPNTGKMLKGPNHETFMHALEGDIKAGGKVKMDLKTGDMYTYEKGGDTGYSTVEIERSERVYTPDGKLIMETPADAPTHEEGGVKVTLPAGSLVFPKKYYKALDAASGLPEFKKIAKTMLDNAEKAYLSGEPYSSGGKRNKERTYNA